MKRIAILLVIAACVAEQAFAAYASEMDLLANDIRRTKLGNLLITDTQKEGGTIEGKALFTVPKIAPRTYYGYVHEYANKTLGCQFDDPVSMYLNAESKLVPFLAVNITVSRAGPVTVRFDNDVSLVPNVWKTIHNREIIFQDEVMVEYTVSDSDFFETEDIQIVVAGGNFCGFVFGQRLEHESGFQYQ